MTEAKPARRYGVALARLGALVACVAISLFVYSMRDQTQALARYGLPGIFLISLISNATIVLPAPALALTFALGGFLHPAGVALASAAGATLGELTGYLAGFTGQAIIPHGSTYAALEQWTRKYGGIAILTLAALPNPFFDIAGATAGMLRMPVGLFLLWTWLGKTIKMLVIAYAGASSLDWIMTYLGWVG